MTIDGSTNEVIRGGEELLLVVIVTSESLVALATEICELRVSAFLFSSFVEGAMFMMEGLFVARLGLVQENVKRINERGK